MDNEFKSQSQEEVNNKEVIYAKVVPTLTSGIRKSEEGIRFGSDGRRLASTAFTKGVSGNPSGRPSGVWTLKMSLQKLLTKENAAEIVQTLINMAVKEKNIKAMYLIAELTGDLGRQAQVAIQVNQTSDENLINKAKQYAQVSNDNVIVVQSIEDKPLNENSGSTIQPN